MTVTPAALASCSMCAPVPESSGQMISTVAPLVMADCAMLTCLASLPRASCTVRFADGSPAAANAAFRYGSSNSSHRVDDVVSGRMTATLPLPSGASGASAFRALNVGPMSLTVRDGVLALELDGCGARSGRRRGGAGARAAGRDQQRGTKARRCQACSLPEACCFRKRRQERTSLFAYPPGSRGGSRAAGRANL